jgi:tetratricopeptide (TPR) repeat protein
MGERVLQAAERLQDPYLETLTYLLLCFDPLQRGHLGVAGEWAGKLIDLGKRAGYPPAQSLGWVCSAWVAAFAQDHAKALVDSELALSASHGKFEKLMADSAQGVVLTGAGRAEAGRAILERVRREIIRCGYLVQLTAIEIPCGLAMAGTGDYAAGVADLENTLKRFAKWRNPRMMAWGHLVLGEIYLQLATAGRLPPPRILRKNASFFVRALPGAKRRARRHFEEAVQFAQKADTAGTLAQALTGLGELNKTMGQTTLARGYLEEARQIAEGLNAAKLIERIDAAL